MAYRRATSLVEARTLAATPGSRFLAGGTDLVPLMKAGAATPTHLIDLSYLGLDGISADGAGLRLGALSRLADVAADARVQSGWPLIAEAILASASGQVRNMATLGGALLQRTRCAYFRGGHPACDKRRPGSGCGAREGQNRQHALFGAATGCVAVHPSDLATALTALDAEIETDHRRFPIAELYCNGDGNADRDTVLADDEIILALHIPPPAGARSAYLKVRDRASFEFAVVAAAGALRIEAGVVTHIRLVAGGVASRPWRLAAAEQTLLGAAPDRARIAAAAEAALAGAQPLAHNGFKLSLLRNSIVRLLETLGAAA